MEHVSIAYGLLVAVLWGINDSIATIASRRVGSMITTLVSLFASIIVLLLFGSITGLLFTSFHLSPPDLFASIGLGLLSGVGAAAGYFSLYRGLELGPLAIVSPLISVDGAVAAVLAVLLLGETLLPVQALLLAGIFVGIVCASTNIQELQQLLTTRNAPLIGETGVHWGLLATVTFGGMLFCIGAASKYYGWFLPILWTRLFACLFLSLVALARRRQAKSINQKQEKRSFRKGLHTGVNLAILVGILESAGLLTYSLGTERTGTSVVAAISSCFGLIPLFIGIVVLREHPTPIQVAGIAIVMTGLLTLSLLPT